MYGFGLKSLGGQNPRLKKSINISSQGGGADWFEQKSDHAVTGGTEHTDQIILQVNTLSHDSMIYFLQRVRSEEPEETDRKDLQEGGI